MYELARRIRDQKNILGGSLKWNKQLTEVNICHGSKKRNDTKNQRTYVERRETIKVKKSWFLNSSPTLKAFSATCACIDLTVMKIEAKTR